MASFSCDFVSRGKDSIAESRLPKCFEPFADARQTQDRHGRSARRVLGVELPQESVVEAREPREPVLQRRTERSRTMTPPFPPWLQPQCLGFNLWLLRCRLEQADAFQLVGEASTVRAVEPLHGRTTRPGVAAEAAAGKHCLARR